MPTNDPKLSYLTANVVEDIATGKLGRSTLAALKPRKSELGGKERMMLMSVAMNPLTREALDSSLDGVFRLSQFNVYPETIYDEIVIGGGIHAAIYCTSRVRKGFPKPVVLEGSSRVGGAFAMSKRPAFYLNSENRPGYLPGIPREGDALNVLPGAPLQVSDFTNREFPTNTDIAFAARLALAEYANVVTDAEVESVDDYESPIQIVLTNGTRYRARRVIDARGIGKPDRADLANGDTILTFPQFMARQDEDFPIQGFDRIAIVGGGNSAMCAVEAAVGIGPESSMRSATLDTVNRIDWYVGSSGDLPKTNQEWKRTQRGRYARIGSYLPDENSRDSYHQVTVYQSRGTVTPGLDSVIVNNRTYDHVIIATGTEAPKNILASRYTETCYAKGDRREANALGMKAERNSNYLQVGPICNLGFNSAEIDSGIANIEANRVSLFRYAPKTAALAATLPVSGFE